MVSKRIYLEPEDVQRIDTIIGQTGQSFSEYIRSMVEAHEAREWYLPTEYLNYHTQEIATLNELIHKLILVIAERDLNDAMLYDLENIQLYLRQLLEQENILLKAILHYQEGYYGNFNIYAV